MIDVGDLLEINGLWILITCMDFAESEGTFKIYNSKAEVLAALNECNKIPDEG